VPVSVLVSIQSFGGMCSTVEQGRSLDELVHCQTIVTCITVTFSACRGSAAPAMLSKSPDWTGKSDLTLQ
jgi:hypothetical protein